MAPDNAAGVQSDWTSVSVSRSLWKVLDDIKRHTGLKKAVFIEKAVISFVQENRKALQALGLPSEEIDRIVGSLELSSELTIEEAA